ncbi:tyrosine-type recombinase/integrase [Streptosporangium canum]|uniref:tyrosine-type recombinase/integrase n=1 Tax=Streptosporangium canum TaxID=324952 RepID=UPI00379C467E
MTAALELVATSPAAEDPVAAKLWSAITPDFLSLVGWDPQIRMLILPEHHPVLGWRSCVVERCDKKVSQSDKSLCTGCNTRFRKSGLSWEQFIDTSTGAWRGIGIGTCSVPDCPRPWLSSPAALCAAHHDQRTNQLHLPMEAFLAHPQVAPFASFGPCQVLACDRDRDGHGFYCTAHGTQMRRRLRAVEGFDEQRWARTAPAIAQHARVSLRGLPHRVVAELIYGLQARTKDGSRTKDHVVRRLADQAREQALATLEDMDSNNMTKEYVAALTTMRKSCILLRLTPEAERHKDVWEAAVFGHAGTLRFTEISQPWLREAAKAWAYDDLPRRYGNGGRGTVQSYINHLVLLSTSLRLQRDDYGNEPRALGRDDIMAFCNRLAYLTDSGDISANTRLVACRNVRRLLARMRTLGLTLPGKALHGLPENFALGPEDIPDEPEDTEVGKDLPTEVMRVLCDNLDIIETMWSKEVRVAIELIIDTGRRPDEIAKLSCDCLERDGDGKPVLIYDNHKNLRNGRKLPIGEATAALIVAQQERIRAQFPNTPAADLKLLPSRISNPEGRKGINDTSISERHRAWVDALPPILVPITVQENGKPTVKMLPFDKTKIFPYAHRHTYAQRHADAGVRPDVLQKLMDHRLLSTTQRYYRVGEERRREAVERVVTMQFDRHGNRVWRQAQTLLDSEHSRRSVGEVATAYGGCTEPSNVAAGGHSCPFRFRCVGCGHFRTDVSYLPDLETYLADLLRSRERLLAAVEVEDWARAEAMPSDEEIKRVRRLITRIKADVEDLSEEEKAQIMAAVAVVRQHRQGVVGLGMPRVRQPSPDVRPDRVA